MARRRSYKKGSPDFIFMGVVFLLVVFGLVMLASASSDLAKEQFGDSFYYLRHQITRGLILGILGFIFGMLFPYRKLEQYAVPILVISIILLILVFTPLGIKVKGSERWVGVGPFSFQPGEIIKLSFIIFLSAWASNKNRDRAKSFVRGLIPFLILIGIVSGLLFLQPSTTTAVIIGVASVITYFAAGANFRFLAAILLVGVLAVGLLTYITPYRMQRIMGFFDPSSDPLGGTYHINQALLAIGSGGLTGVGFGESTTKLYYLPEPIGDSIFAVIAEEFGFIGSMGIILLFFVFVWRGFLIGKHSRDDFGRLLAFGFTSLIGIQTFINIGAISGLLPLTGVPLPFVSFGGTALAVFLTMSGILVNISKSR